MLVTKNDFGTRIKRANSGESRWFIGIGPEYKALLLTLLLVQPVDNAARRYVVNKLGIEKLGLSIPGGQEITEPVIRLVLERPEYARGEKRFDIEVNVEDDRYWKAAGITKEFLDGLTGCVERSPGNLTLSEGYLASDDRYVLYISVAKFLAKFGERGAEWQFRQFDNLKTLGMLSDISVPLKLKSGADGNVSFFSDGQFQVVYICAISEFFKDRNCLTLLDEPDAFLHPE